MLTIPKSKTIGIYTKVDGKDTFLDFSSEVSEINPALTGPSILDLINNTSAPICNKMSDVIIRTQAKCKPVYIYADGKLVQDPTEMTPDRGLIDLVMIKPYEVADKYKLDGIDIQTDPDIKKTVALRATNFISETRINKENLAFAELALAAQTVQEAINKDLSEDKKILTFKQGAHVQYKNLDTAWEIKEAIQQAKKVLKTIGTGKAKTEFDANNLFTTGIDIENNAVLLIDEDIKDKLMELDGLVSSDKGFELFKNAKLERILGLTTYSTSNLPDGVNFLLVTNGSHGAYVHNTAGPGYWASVINDPSWPKDSLLNQALTQYQGVVYESYIISSCNEGAKVDSDPLKNSIKNSSDKRLGVETYDISKLSTDSKEIAKFVTSEVQKQLSAAQQNAKNSETQDDETEDN